jgi:hypothetical protein
MRATLCLLLAAILVFPALAARRKSDPGPHPLKVLKAKVNARQGTNNNSVGDMTVWVQNTTDVLVDKVRVELELYDDGKRLVEKKVKELGDVEPGVKNYIDFRWDIIGERNVTFKIWIYYNGGLTDRLTQFEGEPPVW